MDNTEITTLKTLLDWGMRYGAAQVAFWLINKLVKGGWLYSYKVFFSWGVAGLLAILVWGFGIEMQYIAAPVGDWRAWVEGAAGVVTTVLILNRAIYASMKSAGRV